MLIPVASHTSASHIFAGGTNDTGGGGEDSSLEDVARDEREYVRERLRAELDRDPSEEEIDEWLREHTEGY